MPRKASSLFLILTNTSSKSEIERSSVLRPLPAVAAKVDGGEVPIKEKTRRGDDVLFRKGYNLCFGNEDINVQFPALGDFHVENSAAAIICSLLEGVSPKAAELSAKHLCTPTGRLEKMPLETDFSIYIDYAHSPEALEKALISLRPFTRKLTVLFGAGGDRDHGKRPQMGAIAEALADFVILTSDNPRNESPESILADIERGMTKKNHCLISDRREAILLALRQAEKDEIILLAGKGHENYIIDHNGKHSFSEKEIIKKALGIC